ncbi:MAG TPA: RsmE family RNA methyltransferase [Spirochaetia bacterium]|nr:RsmE family RNA methyltransferase [Spirochaetia bacterium]
MRQYLLPASYAGQPTLTVSGNDWRHLTRVLRLRVGDTLAARDVHGTRYRMRIGSMGRTSCVVELAPQEAPADASPAPAQTGPRLTLLQCLPKGRKIDLIVRQATEAGVSRIVPVLSERSLVRAGEERSARLRRIAEEAMEQSGRDRLPDIEDPRTLESISRDHWGTGILFYESAAGALPLHHLLAHGPAEVCILIGPEGGFAAAEVELVTEAGFRIAHLGETVLRVETAALYAIGAVMTIVQERNDWKSVPRPE